MSKIPSVYCDVEIDGEDWENQGASLIWSEKGYGRVTLNVAKDACSIIFTDNKGIDQCWSRVYSYFPIDELKEALEGLDGLKIFKKNSGNKVVEKNGEGKESKILCCFCLEEIVSGEYYFNGDSVFRGRCHVRCGTI